MQETAWDGMYTLEQADCRYLLLRVSVQSAFCRRGQIRFMMKNLQERL